MTTVLEMLRFNFDLTAYAGNRQMAERLSLPAEVIGKLLSIRGGRQFLSRQLISAMDLGEKPLVTFDTALRRLILAPAEEQVTLARVAALSFFVRRLQKTVRGSEVREILGEDEVPDLRQAIWIEENAKDAGAAFDRLISEGAWTLGDLGRNCLAAWILSEEEAVRKRIMLGMPEATMPASCQQPAICLERMQLAAERREMDHVG